VRLELGHFVRGRLAASRLGALTASANRRRIVDSTTWTLAEHVVALGFSWVVSIVVANYLGVSAFGQLVYTIALVGLFGTLATAGLSGLVVRDLVTNPKHRHEILGTVFVIRFVAGVVSSAALVGSTYVLGTGPSNHVLIAIVAGGLCFRATEVVQFWFQSETRLRYVAIAGIGSTVFGGALRLALVVAGGSLVHFAWAFALGQVVSGLLLLGVYRFTVGPVRFWFFSGSRAVTYIRQSWPLILSGVANTLNLRVDQVLLGAMLGSTAVGTYAVAARLSEVWYFVPVALVGAVFPSMIRAKERGEDHYRQRLRMLYGLFAWGAIGVAAVVTLAAGPVINGLYDSGFSGAAGVLVIHVWTAPFLFMGVIFSRWLIIEGMLISSLIRHGFGASLNIALNLVLIPAHGPKGAAVATLISYAAATYGACFLTRRTWSAGVDMTMGLLLPIRFIVGALRRTRGETPAAGLLSSGRPQEGQS
jgi:O-antigen/teichoic acid export membrane protein